MRNKYDEILSMYLSDEKSLKSLARRTPYDEFEFYRGSHLVGLDLSNQDLTNMNFDGADIRFSNLSGSKFDPGAFNGAVRDSKQDWLIDEYEFYVDDVFNHPIDEVLIFCVVRPLFIGQILSELGIGYGDFSKLASVSTNALRKARNLGVIAHETAFKIFDTILKLTRDTQNILSQDTLSILKQPCVQFVSGGINAPFKHVSKRRLKDIIEMREFFVEIRTEVSGVDKSQIWRNTPEALEWIVKYYRRQD
ncbi:pentapeptide repeat-containing protein [Sphingomonas yabuuchiae]|uniref:pentapeptide repeat-containing protein n=1 Tax=Sphingomonas yabuuchiae TaxID=172044 RepID=UPI003D99BB61